MDDDYFYINSESALQQLLEFAEELEQKCDIAPNLDSGVLSIIMPDDKEYIINRHLPTKQIWVSSPYTGAGYFEFVNDSWQPKRSEAAQGRDLLQFIRDEIKSHID